jgi:integrase
LDESVRVIERVVTKTIPRKTSLRELGVKPPKLVGSIRVNPNCKQRRIQAFKDAIKAKQAKQAAEDAALAKVERTPAAQKPELGEKLLRAARAAFEKRPLWMRSIFEICAHIGCRFSEAAMPLSQVDFKRKIIWIEDSKRPPGDPRKMYSVPMPTSLVDYLKTIRKHPRTAPPVTGDMNRVFNIVLKKATGATSHSLRVSFISRCHRAGLSEMQAMRLVNHSSQLVHRIYSRLSVEDARAAMSKVTPPPLP